MDLSNSLKVGIGQSLIKNNRSRERIDLNNTCYNIYTDKSPNVSDWANTKAALLIKINRITEENKTLKLRNTIMEDRISNLETQLSSIAVLYIMRLDRENNERD